MLVRSKIYNHYRRKRSFYTCLAFCPGGGVLSQHALQVVSQHVLQQVSKRGGGIPASPCRFPGPHPGGKLRGSDRGGVSRPTPGQGLLRGVPAPGGLLWREICCQGGCLFWRVPAPRGVCSQGDVETPLGRLLLRTVHILLECILEYNLFTQFVRTPGTNR